MFGCDKDDVLERIPLSLLRSSFVVNSNYESLTEFTKWTFSGYNELDSYHSREFAMAASSLSHINVNLLVALDLLLDERSVTNAAARAGVTPSAMSHSLRALRELFDDPLFTRTHGGMAPTPLAQTLGGPLKRALRDLSHVLRHDAGFDPSTAQRGFVICAPDFIATMLVGQMTRLMAQEAPGIDLEVRPLARMGGEMLLRQAAQLEDGSIDLVVGALLPQMPGLLREELYAERFVCVVREGHPTIGEGLTLEAFAATPQLLITITDGRSPTNVDHFLETHGLQRRIQVRTRYFMMAPHIIAQSDLLLTCPYQLAKTFARILPLRLLEPPIEPFHYHEYQAWHRRFDADPAHQWLRGLVKRAADQAVGNA